jgi:hypothetical protein
MLPFLDSLIRRDYLDPLARPHQLLLTGDQIYADDVPACLLATLRETAEPLLGWTPQEKISIDGEDLLAADARLTPGPARDSYEEWHKLREPTTPESRLQLAAYRTRLEFIYSTWRSACPPSAAPSPTYRPTQSSTTMT